MLHDWTVEEARRKMPHREQGCTATTGSYREIQLEDWQRATARRGGNRVAVPVGVVPVRIAAAAPRPEPLIAVVVRGFLVADVQVLSRGVT